MAETKHTPEDLAAKRVLAAFDEMAETWAAEVSLTQMVAAVADKDDRESRIEALCRQAFVEGAYRLFLKHEADAAALGGICPMAAARAVKAEPRP